MFSGLSDLVIEGVADENDLIRVMARTRDEPVPCPMCGVLTARVHGFFGRTVTDVPVDGRTVVVSVTVRRLVCPVLRCPRQTFREQVPGLLERYQRCTNRLTGQLGAVVAELAGRAGARLSQALDVAISRSTALRLLMRLPLPPPRVPRVLGVDDFALKRRHRYATILTDAETGERVDVISGRGSDALELWLRAHPGVEVVNLVMDLQDTGCRACYLIRDRGGKFPALVDEILAEVCIQTVLTGIRTPWTNAIMERWVQSCRRELLDRCLRHTLRKYEQFCNWHRARQALAQAVPLRPVPDPKIETVLCRRSALPLCPGPMRNVGGCA
ncbi:transposase family protein [Microbispora amethystogenes]|uniref:transposase family protein n=1 Tax=Microbispora amethystogenes TaxID=1427754 RepID=UPI0033FD0A1A